MYENGDLYSVKVNRYAKRFKMLTRMSPVINCYFSKAKILCLKIAYPVIYNMSKAVSNTDLVLAFESIKVVFSSYIKKEVCHKALLCAL